MSEAEILFERRGAAGVITLNRPKALNALTQDMCTAMRETLQAWAEDEDIAVVAVRSTGERAFCAGGDIRVIYEHGRRGEPGALDLFREEYRNNAAVHAFPKPFVALMEGVVMGGGVGISVHGSHRVGGENVVVAMPEAGIGLVPDVGTSYVLSRLPGEIGTYMALTGARLSQADALWCGIVTHAVPASAHVALLDELAERPEVDEVIQEFAREAPAASLPDYAEAIERCFSADTVEGILARLDAEAESGSEWARGTAVTLRERSPTSLKLALRLARAGAAMSFEDCIRTEFRIVARILQGHDFYEGTRAQIVDKDRSPRWQPATLAEVTDAEIDRYFEPLGEAELRLP